MGMEEALAPGPNFNRPVKDLVYKDLLTSTFYTGESVCKVLVTTSRMGQTAVCMGKGTALGKRDTTLPHRHTFTRKIIPATDKRHEENMTRLKSKMKKIGGTIMSDGG